MRCMMAVVLLGITALSTYGQRKPVPNVNSQTIISDDSEWMRLKERASGQPAKTYAGGTVSVEELKVPEKAMKEVSLSDKALLAGDVRESAEHLEKALAIDPAVAAWHNGLGSRYSALKKYDEAISEFEKALALDPRYQEAADNITVALLDAHRYGDAEPAARRALEIDPTAESSQYLLGCTLVQEGHYSSEAQALLEKVKPNYKTAGLYLAKGMIRQGRPEEAAAELREYLQAGTMDRKMVQLWLEALERQEAAKKGSGWVMPGDE